MATITKKTRTRAYLRLRPQLVEKLKAEAESKNKSFNSYVESLLYDAVFWEPNEETVEAIKESRRGEYAGIVNLSSMEDFKQSMGL